MKKKILLILILLIPFIVKADSVSIECPEKIKAGETGACVVTGNSTQEIQSLEAIINLSDNLSLVSVKLGELWQGDDFDDGKLDPFTLSGDTIIGDFDICVITVKAKDNTSDKNDSVKLANIEFGTDDGDYAVDDSSDTIRIPSNDNTLKELSVDGVPITPKFDPTVTKYTGSTKNSSVNVTAVANSKFSTVTQTGKVDLKNGKNEINVNVTAEDGSKKTYTITLTADIYKPTDDPVNPDEPVPTPGDKTDEDIDTNISTGSSYIYLIIAIGIITIVGMTLYYKKLTSKK